MKCLGKCCRSQQSQALANRNAPIQKAALTQFYLLGLEQLKASEREQRCLGRYGTGERVKRQSHSLIHSCLKHKVKNLSLG